MSFEAVDFVVATALGAPIPNVVVKIFSADSKTVYTQQVTDNTGTAAFLLDSSVSYQARFYAPQVIIKNPLFFNVISAPVPPQSNIFDVVGEVFVPPISTNPRLCVASGFFLSPDGSPAANVDMHFIPIFDPILLDGKAVLIERSIIRTDSTGYAQISLIRNGQYEVTVQGFEDVTRVISIPDNPSTNLPDLIFPVVVAVLLSPPGPYNLTVGQQLVLTSQVVTSSGLILPGTAQGDVVWQSSDSNVLGLFITDTTITITGAGVGSAQLNVSRQDLSIIRIPELGIAGSPQPVTVS